MGEEITFYGADRFLMFCRVVILLDPSEPITEDSVLSFP